MAEVKVFGAWGSPFSRRVEMALKLKGVKYEYIEEDLVNKSPLLLQYNPIHKKVPVLLHNGKPIVESLIILEYIDETFDGPAILPQDPYQKAQARFWAKFIDEKCIPAMWRACWSSGEERKKARDEAIELLKFLEDEVKGKRFFGGDNIGFLDFGANFIGYWFGIVSEVVGLESVIDENLPNLSKWIDEFNSCSIVKENVPAKDRMVEYFKSRTQLATGPKYD